MELKITGTLVLDLGDWVDAVEAAAGPYMLPNPEGLYLPTQCEPVMVAGQPYFYAGEAVNSVATPIPITSFELPLRDEVYDAKADLVVPKVHLPYLKPQSRFSLRARNLLIELIDHMVINHAKWSSQGRIRRGHKKLNFDAVIRPFLFEQFQRSGITVDSVFQYPKDPNDANFSWGETGNIVAVEHEPTDDLGRARISEQDKQLFYASQEICESITLQLSDMLHQLTDFLGQDRWIMHFMKVDNTVVRVEKTIDYRIYSWMMEHGRDFED
jgi:hypothetical protein